MTRTEKNQMFADRFYTANGPCCAGCDWWDSFNGVAGQCTRSAPVAGTERLAMLGMTGVSRPIGAGHIMTPREHRCGDFKDEFDWGSLPPHYLKLIGRNAATETKTT